MPFRKLFKKVRRRRVLKCLHGRSMWHIKGSHLSPLLSDLLRVPDIQAQSPQVSVVRYDLWTRGKKHQQQQQQQQRGQLNGQPQQVVEKKSSQKRRRRRIWRRRRGRWWEREHKWGSNDVGEQWCYGDGCSSVRIGFGYKQCYHWREECARSPKSPWLRWCVASEPVSWASVRGNRRGPPSE